FFKVHFPLRGIRIGCPFDLDMPLNGHVPCTKEREFMGWPLVMRICPHEGPLAALVRAKVFLRYPVARLLWMPPSGPCPQSREDGCVYFGAGDFAHDVGVIVRPPT